MNNRTSTLLLLSLTLAGTCVSHAQATGPCPPDTNCSGAVEVDDLLAVINAWGTANPVADIDGSGSVDVNDLLGVINAWGPCVFDFGPAYPDAEAHQIGLEMLGDGAPLVCEQARYDRIVRDQALIRAAYPGLVGQTHSMAWVPTQFIAAVIQGQPTDNFECLNAWYQVVSVEPLFSSGGIDYKTVTLAHKANIPALCSIYTALPEIDFAEPNGLIGGQNFWVPTDQGAGTWRWEIDDGFHDCFDGCDCHRLYVIDVDLAGNVTLISYQEVGQSWCQW